MDGEFENEMVVKNGEEFLKVKNFKMKTEPKKVKFHFGNLFGGEPTLGKILTINYT